MWTKRLIERDYDRRFSGQCRKKGFFTPAVSFIFALQVLDFSSFGTAFAATVVRERIQSKAKTTLSTRLWETLSWSGNSNASLDLGDVVSEEKGLSIQDWLDDPKASNYALLGSDDVEETSNGAFLCRQPPVGFLGITLQPLFLNNVARTRRGSVIVSILDAQTEVAGLGSGRVSNLASSAIQKILKDSKFLGRSVVQFKDNQLFIDLNLTLKVSLPPFLLLPPGFNSMGSAMMRRTGQARSKQLLTDLKRNYEDWLSNKLKNQKTGSEASVSKK